MTERWETVEAIAAARDRFEAAIPGWRPPAAFGIARDGADGPSFARVGSAENRLPAAVLATVCEHVGGSGSYRLGRDDLERVIGLLAPAQACTDVEHPNLVAWQRLYADLAPGEHVVAVFAADLTDAAGDRYVAALQAAALAG
ncbi:hypothetical protein [Dactylosporangium sp. NPDC051484]|uniref:hypothetical protein n=1 Tax=Dactylosporangium sp. NPDC051484 TaxID=3154942 RepID=UPI0034509D86